MANTSTYMGERLPLIFGGVNDLCLEDGNISPALLEQINRFLQAGHVAMNDSLKEAKQTVKEAAPPRSNGFDLSILYYSEALNLKPGDPVILSIRSAAYIRISTFFKRRPAKDTEWNPLVGNDPTKYAELALKDVEKVINILSNSVKSYCLKASALELLERYEDAHETLLCALNIEPLSDYLQESLRNLEAISGGLTKRIKHGKPALIGHFNCQVCLELLCEPITTPCGHSFCRSCLFQSDHGNHCPMCWKVIFMSPSACSISVTLNNIIQKYFTKEYTERKLEIKTLPEVHLLPLFVWLDVVLPCQKFTISVFEPRYRLMVRRVMEGHRRMGMVEWKAFRTPASGSIVACEVEITKCEPLEDGRYEIEVETRRRCHILQSWEQDGYCVAKVEWFRDTIPPQGTKAYEDWQATASDAADLACLLERDTELPEAVRIPAPQDPELFSFWLVSLLRMSKSDRLWVLELADTQQRVQYVRLTAQENNLIEGSDTGEGSQEVSE